MRDLTNVRYDIARTKRKVKQRLLENRDLLEALSFDLNPDSPDDYLRENILGYLRIPTTQCTVKNFVCVTVDDVNQSDKNTDMKTQSIRIFVFCHLDSIKTPWNIDRHDLISYFIIEALNWSNIAGTTCRLAYNAEKSLDSDYFGREMKFELININSVECDIRQNRYDPRY